MIFLLIKGAISVLGFLGGKLFSGLPFLLQHLSAAQDNDHEYRMAQLEAETRKHDAVARIEDLKAQVEAIQATAEIQHQQALDRDESKIIDSTVTGQPLPFSDPRSRFQIFVDGIVALTNAYNAWMRPISFTVILTVDVGLVCIEAWSILINPTMAESAKALGALGTVEVLTDALPVILGHLWGERSFAKRMEQ